MSRPHNNISTFKGGKRRRSSKKSSNKRSKKMSTKKRRKFKSISKSKQRSKSGGKHRKSSKSISSNKRRKSRSLTSAQMSKGDYSLPNPEDFEKPANNNLADFKKLYDHIVKNMKDLKIGPVAVQLAAMYKKEVLEKNPNLTFLKSITEAIKLFDADSTSERESKLAKAKQHVEEVIKNSIVDDNDW